MTELPQESGKKSALLSPVDAAFHLGITPELLFAYTEKRFEKTGSGRRRLQCHEDDGHTRFLLDELEDFDCHLNEPWAPLGSPRVDPPKCIINHLRAESFNQCARCGSGVGVETAHIDPWADSRCNHHHNLIRICTSCHKEHDRHGCLPTEILKELKHKLVARTRGLLKARATKASARFRPPNGIKFFCGRQSALSDLRRIVCSQRSVLIRGLSGVGKTQLLLRALQGIETGRPVLWIDVESYGSVKSVRAGLEVLMAEQAYSSELRGLGERLDALQACVVFDGAEQVKSSDADELDDFVTSLQATTCFTQFIVTSQVDILRATFDEAFTVGGLDQVASHELFSGSLRNSTQSDAVSNDAIVRFSDGHALTLILSAKLSDYYGSTKAASERINSSGAAAIALPKRGRHDRTTSLAVCLSLVYHELDREEQGTAFLIANCPGGIFTGHLKLQVPDERDLCAAVAGLQRWCLVETDLRGQTQERLRCLSPVASYINERWNTEHPEESRQLVRELLSSFAAMAHVIERKLTDPSAAPHVMARFDEELPNLLRIVDFAESNLEDVLLGDLCFAVCVSLMEFFFFSNVSRVGCDTNLRGARVALAHGNVSTATSLIVQAISLSQRDGAYSITGRVEEILNEIASISGSEGSDDIDYALLFSGRFQPENVERLARRMIEKAEAFLHESEKQDAAGVDDSRNRLASIYMALGGALLSQERFNDARSAYESSRFWLRGAAVNANAGQIAHQIGNCHSGLSEHLVAAKCYLEASSWFRSLGMKEYLSNALGELGHTFIDISTQLDDQNEEPELPPIACLKDGLDDLIAEIRRCRDLTLISGAKQKSLVRKLLGMIALVSFSDDPSHLSGLGSLSERQNLPLMKKSKQSPPDESYLVFHIEALFLLGEKVAEFHHRAPPSPVDVQQYIWELAELCALHHPWKDVRTQCFSWLAAFLVKKKIFKRLSADDFWLGMLGLLSFPCVEGLPDEDSEE